MSARTCGPRQSSSTEGLVATSVPGFRLQSCADINEPHVRRWRKNLLDAGVGPVTAAKAYRLLKAILNTAVDDGMIRRNPCRIKGAGEEKSPERLCCTLPGLRPGRRVRSTGDTGC